MAPPAPAQHVEYDLPGVQVACAQDASAPTGLTLVRFVDGALAAVDVRGGAVAGRELAGVSLDDAWGEIDGVLFVGGSTWGLGAAEGVIERLTDERGATSFDDIPSIPTVAVYDFTGREDDRVPDADMAATAFGRLSHGRVPVGRVGAGSNVLVGSLLGDEHAVPSGQGAAFGELDGVRALVVAVVNCSGNVYARDGSLVAGGPDPLSALRDAGRARPSRGNTLLLTVVTDLALDRLALRRVAVMVQAAAARVVEPLHTPEDGDVCFACSVARTSSSSVGAMELGVLAGRLAQDAILGAVRAARP